MKLQIEKVGKTYDKDFKALDNISLEIENGVCGILGPNGAGKSTLMKIIATLTRPTEGRVLYNGIDIHKNNEAITRELGYLPQNFGVYENLNTIDFLRYIAAVKGLDMRTITRRIDELVNLLNLNDVAKRAIGTYSGGMRQRVGIAQALLNDPGILIVDEPTVGLDPEERIRFRNIMSDLSKNKIILLSTHIVSDIEAIASKIAIISKGHVLANDITDNLIKETEKYVWECKVDENQFEDIKRKFIISNSIRYRSDIQVRIVSKEKPLNAAVNVVPVLEDAYLYKVNYSI